MEFHKFLILIDRRGFAAAFQNPTNMYVDIEAWNFVIRSWKSDGKVMEFCREDFVATLTYLSCSSKTSYKSTQWSNEDLNIFFY